MLRTCQWIACGLVLTASALLAQAPDQAPAKAAAPAKAGNPAATKAHRKKSHKTPKPVVLPAMPRGPLSQLPMDQIPATPAKVSYQGGLLSISAQNSPMGEILREVRKLTGASIEIPPHAAASDERVITHLGPGTPRDVLVALLNGSSFNYVMLGSNTDPRVISNIILTSKTPATGETQTAAVNTSQPPPAPGVVMPPHPQPFNPQLGQPQPGQPEADDSSNDEPADDSANQEEQPQPGQPGQPDINGANAQEEPQPQQDPNQPNAGPKTPEQILEMLRRQQPQPGNGVPPPQPPPQQ
jgi:hypothetical protein